MPLKFQTSIIKINFSLIKAKSESNLVKSAHESGLLAILLDEKKITVLWVSLEEQNEKFSKKYATVFQMIDFYLG